MAYRTILFVDQVGSTQLLAEIGDEAMLVMRQQLWHVINAAVDDQQGRVFSDEGDGGAAVFEGTEAAAIAAHQMLRGARTHDLEIRIGLHAGTVIANGDGFVGLAVHVAARLCDEAPTGRVVTSAETGREFADTRWQLAPFGQRAIKGLATPIDVALLTDAPVSNEELDVLRAPQTWDPLPSSPRLQQRPPLSIGRSPERARLRQRADAALSGTAQLVLLEGNPGAGKSTLAVDVASELSAEGAMCVLGRADEAFDDPLHEVIEMLRHVIEHAPTQLLADHVLRHGDLLTRLLPGLADRVPSASRRRDDVALVPDRALLFEAAADLIASVSRFQPVVLVLEDIHWTSDPTLDFLRFSLRRFEHSAVFIIATYRGIEAVPESAVAQFINRMLDQPRSTTISLRSFAPAELDALFGVMLPSLDGEERLRTALADHIASQSGGNPLFSVELLRGLATDLDSGVVDPRRWSVSELIERIPVPDSVQDLARARADRLGPAIVDVLTQAAVLGESFSTDELREMTSSGSSASDSVPDVLDALDAAERFGLVRPEDEGGRRFSFGHALMQAALYGQLTTSERIRRHRAAANMIGARIERAEATFTTTRWSSTTSRAADMLRHLQSSGVLAEPAEIARYGAQAAVDAADRLALVDVVRFRQIVVEATLGDLQTSNTQRAEALAALGRAQTAAGQHAGKQSMVEAAAHARRARAWALFAEIAADYGGDIKENQAVYAVEEPIALIEEALAHHAEPTAMRSRLLITLALWKRQHTPYLERRPFVDEAISIARSLGDEAALTTVLALHHRALHGPNITEEALSNAAELEATGSARQDDALIFQALNVRLIASVESGDWPLAVRTGEELAQTGEQLQHIEGRRLTLMWRTVLAHTVGDNDEGRRLTGEVKRLLVGYPDDDLRRFLSALTLANAWLSGQAAAMYKVSASVTAPPTSLAWFAAEAGLVAEYNHAMERTGGVDRLNTQMDYLWWHDAVALTRVARVGGDADTAEELYESMLPYRDRNATMGLVAFLGAAEHHLGTLAEVCGKTDTAIAHFEAGLARHEAMGARPFVALSQAELALALERRGHEADLARASDLRDMATSAADELGAELIHQLLR